MKKEKLQLIFMGTPDFALTFLEFLSRKENILTVVTQPDRPSGRKRTLTTPPVKDFAIDKGIKVYQPEKLSEPDCIKKLTLLRPDLIVVVAYGGMLPVGILRLPESGCVNIHPSLLPRYRGPCPVERALIKGEKETGVSSIYMDEGMDTGEIIVQRKLAISVHDTAGTLRERLKKLGAEVLDETLRKIKTGEAKAHPQKGKPTYAGFIKKKECIIDWMKSASEIHNLIRGLNPDSGARATLKGHKEKLIIWESCPIQGKAIKETPGEVIEVIPDGMVVSTGKGRLLVKKVQPEGGKKQTGTEYYRGHRIEKFEINYCSS